MLGAGFIPGPVLGLAPTTLGVATIVTRRSACPGRRIVTATDATLLAETGSETPELTVAVLVTAPATVGVAAIVTVADAPLANVPSAHEIACPLAPHVP